MNVEQFAGLCREFAGRINETLGDLIGDPLRSTAGRRSRAAGKTQQRSGVAKAELARQLRDFQNRNRNWHFQEKRENAK